MFLHLILGAVALLAGASVTGWALLVLGVRRGDRGKRLTGQPGGSCRDALSASADRFARLRFPRPRGGGPVSRMTDLSAAVYSGRHCHDIDCRKCRARSRWMRRKAWRTRKNPNRRNRGRKR